MKNLLKSTICFFIFCLAPAVADSPLTSTLFHEAYDDIDVVQEAARTKKLSPELSRYLLDSRNPLDHRLALVSALGWDFDGQDNADRFSKVLFGAEQAWFYPKGWQQLSADHLIILAYLTALDDYFDVAQAHEQARLARKKDTDNASIAVIASLIEGQSFLKSRDSVQMKGVWTVTKPALEMTAPPKLRPEALKIIRDYVVLYEE
jgi:hypothetical protein